MNILCGLPQWAEWKINLSKLPYKFYFNDLSNIKVILEIINKYNIDVIIPITLKQMEFVIKNNDKLINNVKKIICNIKMDPINILDNKYEFYQQFSKYVPQVFITQNQNIKKVLKNPSYPCIFKLSKGFGGNGSFVIKTDQELEKVKSSSDYVIQEYITSPDEYGGNFYVENGIIKFFVYYKMTNHKQYHIQRGKLEKYIRITDNNWNDTFSEIFKQINYTGFACANFKLIDGKPVIFEINPRLGGTIVCTNEEDLEKIINSSLL